jgi:hypothetical protein
MKGGGMCQEQGPLMIIDGKQVQLAKMIGRRAQEAVNTKLDSAYKVKYFMTYEDVSRR